MDDYARHRRVWPLLQGLVGLLLRLKFRASFEQLHLDGPLLLVPNHCSAWDPLFVARCHRDRPCYFVASEHLFRLGFVSRIIERLVAPIPRRKASTGMDTVKACLRRLRDGQSVCLFAEGEQCWCGRSQKIFPATGKLAKSSGATLVTMRIEGGYLACPRWGHGTRRGRVRCHPVGVYPPETLAAMSPKEINALIERDIAEDCWQRQREDPARYPGRRLAESLERTLYLCPQCRRIDSLKSKGDRLFCDCGFAVRYTETGFFDPETPFRELAQWDDWQRQQLSSGDYVHGERLFADEDMELVALGQEHREQLLGRGPLVQYADRLDCAGHSFPLTAISDMAAVLSSRLLWSSGGVYYEARARHDVNLRKYLEIWKNR